MGFLERLLGKDRVSSRRVTLDHPLVIAGPKLAFLNFAGDSAKGIVAEDRAALADLFPTVVESERDVPACSVLMLYARLDADGKIEGRTESLREIIEAAGAQVVVVATANHPKSYIAAAQPSPDNKANLVLTLDRRGERFPRFFAELFTRMFRGETMPVAWVKLAPQDKGGESDEVPSTIFSAEISHIIFQR